LTVSFNKTLLAGPGGATADAIQIQPYYAGNVTVKGKKYDTVGSKMQVRATQCSERCKCSV
jgi:hypothetical protein